MADWKSLLEHALLLDVETTSLTRGAGVHELAVYNLGTNELNEFILTPNLTTVAAATPQEHTKLATSARDVHHLQEPSDWIDVFRRQLQAADPTVGALKTQEEVLKALAVAQPWTAKSLGNYPHLLGQVESSSARNARLKELAGLGGTGATRVVTPQELLARGGVLESLLAADPKVGRTIWGANIGFDAKAAGALIGGLQARGVQTGLSDNLQTAGTTVDPWYTTGVSYNRAKVRAQKSGDWTHVWHALLTDQPKAGEVAVRDIQDVLRAMMSYGQKLGVASEGDVYWGTSLDLQYRLMGSLEGGAAGRTKLLAKESHRAAEDLAIHSKYVLERALRYTSALQEVHEETSAGKELLRQAGGKTGDYYEATQLLARQEYLKPDIQEVALIKRLSRAQEDLLTQEHTYQVDGWDAVDHLTQKSPSAGEVQVDVLRAHRTRMSSMDEVQGFLRAQGKYGDIDISAVTQEMQRAISAGTTPEEQRKLLTSWTDVKTGDLLTERLTAKADQIMSVVNTRAPHAGSPFVRLGKAVKTAANTAEITRGGVAVAAVAGAASLAAMGAMWSVLSGSGQEREEPRSLVTYNYQQWLEHQAEFTGSRPESEQLQGMSERGIAGSRRRKLTDFGSPYQGIQGSQLVFQNQQMLDEREKFLRAQYGAIHFDPVDGLFGMNGILARARHQGYSYLPGAEEVPAGYQGLRGRHLMRVNIGDGNWKMSVDDADTVVLKRGGIRGAVSSIFGLNKEYTFRLSGIDAPEVAHVDERTGQALYHAPQPGGYAGAEGFKELLARQGNTELVFNPEETTYGRSLGVLFGEGGKNLNYELVKRGHVAFLPFGNERSDMLRWGALGSMQKSARAGTRGMWAHPYWQAYYDVSETSGETTTFNTFTRINKIAEKQSTMDTLALMEQAEASGRYEPFMAEEAVRIGQTTHRGIDAVAPAVVTGNTASHYSGYLQDMLRDTALLTRTKGSKHQQAGNAFSARSGYRNLDKAMVLDSMGHTNSSWSRRRLAAFDHYQVDAQRATDRKYRMMAAQQQVNSGMFNSLQNHTNFQIGG